LSAAAVGALAVAAAALAAGMIPLVGRPLPRSLRHPDAAALADAGWRWGIAQWECLRVAVLIAGIAAAYAAAITPVAGLLLAPGPSMAIRLRAGAARRHARAGLAEILLTAHAMLRSGVALPEALRRAAAGCEDRLARRPFEVAIERFDLGQALDDALRSAATMSADHRSIATFHTLALGVTERLPIERAAALVEAVAERAMHDERVDADVRARTAGVRLQSYLLAAIVPALALYLVLSMPGLGATLGTPLGRTVLLPAAAVLEAAGILVSRRVVDAVTR
jgi:Flp pilus assembly protein TadB